MFDSLWHHESQHSQGSLSITNSQSLLKLMPIKWVMPSNYLILCCPLLLLPLVPLSIRVFSNESTLRIRWTKYWRFSFSISPSNEHPGLISFRTDWLDLLVVQGTLRSLLQHHSSKASFFGPHLSFRFIIHLWDVEMMVPLPSLQEIIFWHHCSLWTHHKMPDLGLVSSPLQSSHILAVSAYPAFVFKPWSQAPL